MGGGDTRSPPGPCIWNEASRGRPQPRLPPRTSRSMPRLTLHPGRRSAAQSPLRPPRATWAKATHGAKPAPSVRRLSARRLGCPFPSRLRSRFARLRIGQVARAPTHWHPWGWRQVRFCSETRRVPTARLRSVLAALGVLASGASSCSRRAGRGDVYMSPSWLQCAVTRANAAPGHVVCSKAISRDCLSLEVMSMATHHRKGLPSASYTCVLADPAPPNR
jgi:hypothetical protein